MSYLWAILLFVVLLGGWVLTVVGMPGNWLMVAAVALHAWLVPSESGLNIGLGVVAVVVGLALLGEVLEFLAGMLGAVRGGASRRGALLALAGSMAGGLIGIFVGVPIPIVGPVLGAVLFAALGAFVGAFAGEIWKGRTLGKSVEVGKGALLGRILGTLAKVLVASVIVVLATAAFVL